MPLKRTVKNWRLENTFRDILFENPNMVENERFRHLYQNFREAEDENERVPRVDGSMIYLPPMLEDGQDDSPHKTPIQKPVFKGTYKEHSVLPDYVYQFFMGHYRASAINTPPIARERTFNPYTLEYEYRDIIPQLKGRDIVRVKGGIVERPLALPLLPLRVSNPDIPKPTDHLTLIKDSLESYRSVQANIDTRVSDPQRPATEFDGGKRSIFKRHKKGSDLTNEGIKEEKRIDNTNKGRLSKVRAKLKRKGGVE